MPCNHISTGWGTPSPGTARLPAGSGAGAPTTGGLGAGSQLGAATSKPAGLQGWQDERDEPEI